MVSEEREEGILTENRKPQDFDREKVGCVFVLFQHTAKESRMCNIIAQFWSGSGHLLSAVDTAMPIG